MTTHSLFQLERQQRDAFITRHIGPTAEQQQAMLAELKLSALDELVVETVPAGIRLPQPLALAAAQTEQDALAALKQIASQNKPATSYIGLGYHPTITPNVIQRNVLENPGWYTAYTPYQPEIAQGRLEALLTFQQMVMDLSGLALANASLLDEATAAAEAMALAKRVSKNKKSQQFFVADHVHPQTLDVVKTRAAGFGFEVIVGPWQSAGAHDVFGALLQYPDTDGQINDLEPVIAQLHEHKAVVAVAADIMSLLLLKAPGAMGADVVLGSSQRFGVPMAYGGPHAAFFATREQYKRSLPGRIIGVSKDKHGRPALRMAMQTREQHIRREKANSNICTAQVLLANMAAFYAVYHGPVGLRHIATRIHRLTSILATGLQAAGITLLNQHWFDTLTLRMTDRDAVLARAQAANINVRVDRNDTLSVALNETTTRKDVLALFAVLLGEEHGQDIDELDAQLTSELPGLPTELVRNDDILTHEVFNRYHSETEMLRYIKRLENKDLALNHSMIALGSCTMKLNATAEMMPITWPEFAQLHPFCPHQQAAGYHQLVEQLSDWLLAITGYDAICMQPNSGAQGEYAGLLAIRGYHDSRGDTQRTICLIPSSAHGTNPASAHMAGMKVVVVDCDKQGNIDLADLRAKAADANEQLACIMVTYPSTHGVYEEAISEVCEIIHQYGGQVYLDGANMNAQVGLTSPGFIGADVSHLNLHKTFCIPHGGGGPGMGPIGVKHHLAPFVAGHKLGELAGPAGRNGAVSAAHYGSAGILPISWMYIALMGSAGLTRASEVAILNANYLAHRLGDYFPVLYSGRNGRVAHECILDLRPLKEASGISELDVAKRLMDYGFHAPTMSFPVPGTLMVEPTESEPLAELDRFADAMIAIYHEIHKVETGIWPLDDNPLVNAPHTQADVLAEQWPHPYTRQEATLPLPSVAEDKFWPTVNRIDDVYGDRHLFCSCVPVEAYREAD